MITNESQYRITRRRAADFARAIKEFDAKSHERADVHPRLLRAEREAMNSELAALREELEEYERLKAADPPVIPVASLDQLADGLIKARIAAGLSRRALAERLALKEQQIQRYEAEALCVRQLPATVRGRAGAGHPNGERSASLGGAVPRGTRMTESRAVRRANPGWDTSIRT